MKTYDVQTVEFIGSYSRIYHYIADPIHLPRWTSAFESVAGNHAVLRTPSGSVSVELLVNASQEHGTIDWTMIFPDDTRAQAYSRLIRTRENMCLYSFTLTPPPVSLEELEGTLEKQSEILQHELKTLKRLLEDSDGVA